MSDFDFQDYLSAIAQHYSQQRHLYTLTDVLLPLEAQWSPTDQRSTVEREEDDREKRVEQFPVLAGLRRYALGDGREHVLLAGRPGSGKSTALRQLVAELAAAPQPPILGEHEGSRIPVLVQLKGDRPVPELIKAEFRRMKVAVTEPQIDEWLMHDRLILLLDGVNEMPTEELRRSLAQFREDNRTVPMIFTTRDLSLGGDLGIRKRLEMKPLSERQLREFVGKYLPEQGEKLLGQLRDRLREIAETPLLLKMLCDVFGQTGEIPPNKGELFRLFDREYEKFKSLPAVSADFRRFKSEILQHLAFVMMQGDESKPTEFWLTIARSQAERSIEQWLTSRVSDPAGKAKEWLEDLLEHHLLQVAADGRRVEFHHQLFQEYYAAEALLGMFADKHPDVVEPERFQHFYLNYLKWTESVAIVLSLMEDEEQAVGMVEQALDVDLMLGARLAGEVRSGFQEKTVELIRKLPESKEISQELIIELMGKTGSEQAISYLTSNLNESLLSESAAEALGKIRSDKAVLALLQFIETTFNAGRYDVLVAIGSLGEIGSEKAISILIELLGSLDLSLRGIVADVLARTGSLQAAQTIIKLAEDDDPFISANATIELSKMYPNQFSLALLNLLKDPNSHIRNNAIRSLLNIDSKLSIPALLNLLKNSNSYIRATAAQVLGEIGSEKIVDDLIEALHYVNYEEAGCSEVAEEWWIEDRYAQIKISIALGNIATSLDKKGDLVNSKRVVRFLGESFNKSGLDGKICAAIGLGKHHSMQTIPVLIKALDHPDESVVAFAAVVLGSIGSEQAIKSLEQALVNCIDEAGGTIRDTLLYALGEIHGATLLSKLWIWQLANPHESYRSRIAAIQANCKFYNDEIFHSPPDKPQPTQQSPPPGSLIVHGDYIAGDKIGRDKILGNKTEAPNATEVKIFEQVDNYHEFPPRDPPS